MNDTMSEMNPDDTPLYGPKGLLVCGLPDEYAERFLALVKALGWADVPVGFAGAEDIRKEVGDLFEQMPNNREPLGGVAVIVGGIAQKQLHQIMSAHRMVGLPPSLWAAMTLHNIEWPLAKVLVHITEDHKAMMEARKKKQEEGNA